MPVTSKLCRREIRKFLDERAPDVQPPAADMQKISEIMVAMMNASDTVKDVRFEHIYTAVKTMVHSLESRLDSEPESEGSVGDISQATIDEITPLIAQHMFGSVEFSLHGCVNVSVDFPNRNTVRIEMQCEGRGMVEQYDADRPPETLKEIMGAAEVIAGYVDAMAMEVMTGVSRYTYEFAESD